MRLGIIGGTFNPVHNGHVAIAVEVKKWLNLDKVLFVPAYIQPLRQHEDVASSQDRFRMLQLALEGVDGCEASSIEIDRGGISYTVDTLREFRKTYNAEADELFFIIGSDNTKGFFNWKNPDEILELCNVVVVQRGGYKPVEDDCPDFIIADVPPIDISACLVRKKLSTGDPIDELVPEQVREYISKNSLYAQGSRA